MPDSPVSQPLTGAIANPKCYLGSNKPGVTGIFHITGLRLLLFFPIAVVVSVSVADVLGLLICLCWLLGGSWKERWTIIRNSPVLFAALPFIVLTFLGIFRSSASLPVYFDVLRYWNGHYPLFYVIIFATLLEYRSYHTPSLNGHDEGVFLSRGGNAYCSMLLSSINGAFLLTWGCAAYLVVKYAGADEIAFRDIRAHSFQLYQSKICFSMALNLWIILWIYLPYTSRFIPAVRRRLPNALLEAMEAASRVSLPRLLFSFIQRRNEPLSGSAMLLSVLRWGIVAFTTYYIFFVDASRTAQISILCVYAAALLLKAGWKGLVVSVILGIFLLGTAYAYSVNFQKKVERTTNEIKMFRGFITGKMSEKKYTEKDYMRLGTYYFLIPAVHSRPVFGYGMDEGRKLVNQRTKYGNPHSEFLLIILQHGLVGLAAFLFWVLVFAVSVFRMNSPWKFFGICFGMMLFVDCFFNCALSYHQEAFFLLFLIGILSLPELGKQDSQEPACAD